MFENSIDEFESFFERASIPVFDIPHIELKNLAVVLDGSSVDAAIGAIARYLVDRFGAQAWIYPETGVDPAHAKWVGEHFGLGPIDTRHESPADLAAHLNSQPCGLVLLSESGGDDRDAAMLDELVAGARAPVLIVRGPVADPQSLFTNVLHSLTGNLEAIENLAYSFTLVEDSGTLMLLHTVNDDELNEVRDTLRVSKEISAEKGDAFLENLKKHAERYLKGVVASSREEPYTVSYHLRVGDVIESVEREIRMDHSHLLVVGTHHEGGSHISALEYQLMHRVRTIPVLAL